jgi:hypothetical protein
MSEPTVTRRKRIGWGGLLVVIGIAVAIAVFLAVTEEDAPPALPLTNTFDESPAFSFDYPEAWQTVIPMQNLLVAAAPQTLAGEQVGASFTVQRSMALTREGNLSTALDTYLRRGPLRPDRDWTVVEEVETATLNDHPALVVTVEGRDEADAPLLRSQVVAVDPAADVYYIISLSAPLETWPQDATTLDAMLNTVQITEG